MIENILGLVFFGSLLGVAYFVFGVSVKGTIKKDKETLELLKLKIPEYSDKQGILCRTFEEFDDTSLQFFGTVLKTNLNKGDKLTTGAFPLWPIRHFYLDRHNPEKESITANAHTEDVAVIIDVGPNFEIDKLARMLETDGIILLELAV